MNEFITIDENNNVVIKRNNLDLKEEIKMSLLNMAMNIGHFNIKISVKKDKKMLRDNITRKIEHQQRINNALEERRNLLYHHKMYNSMM